MSSFWHGKRVVVTGGAGFVGSHLVELLVEAGAETLSIDDFSRGYTKIDGAQYFAGDVCSENWNVFHNTFAVFNLAASVAGVLYNQSHQLEMFERNMRLQTAPVIAAERAGVPHFLQVSSVCVYAPEHQTPAIESRGQWDEPIDANAGYSWAKRLGERAALWSTIPHVVIVRPSNMYGPRDYFDDRAHVIPNLINKCLDDNPVISMQSPPGIEREFMYVEDGAQGMMKAIEHGANHEVYNLGTGGFTRISLSDLINEVQIACGTDKEIEWHGGQNAGDSARWSNYDKAERELRWGFKVQLHEGLRRTVKWYQAERMTA